MIILFNPLEHRKNFLFILFYPHSESSKTMKSKPSFFYIDFFFSTKLYFDYLEKHVKYISYIRKFYIILCFLKMFVSFFLIFLQYKFKSDYEQNTLNRSLTYLVCYIDEKSFSLIFYLVVFMC